MTIGEFLKQKREERKLSLRQLAYKVNMSHTNISDVEKGNIRKEESIFRILAALNLSEQEKNEAIQLLRENIPEDLREGVTDIEKKWIYSFIGNIEHNYGNVAKNIENHYGSTQKDLLSDLTEEEKKDVERYIEFLKSKRGQ